MMKEVEQSEEVDQPSDIKEEEALPGVRGVKPSVLTRSKHCFKQYV